MTSKRNRTRSPLQRLAVVALVAAVAAACNDDDDSGQTQPPQTSMTIAAQLDSLGLTTMRAALSQAGLLSLLEGPGPFTLFAPTDAAFAALDPAILAFLLDPMNAALLADVLEYHIADGDLSGTMLRGLRDLTMRTGDGSLCDAIGPQLSLNEGRLVDVDLLASNGRIHVLDAMLTPPLSVVETLQRPDFSTLADLVERAGLEPALSGNDITLFAPTDAAFAALPPGVLADLQDPANSAELVELLTYHVRPALRTASELFYEAEQPSEQGALQYYGLRALVPKVNNVPFVRMNVPATDGIVHSVDTVLAIPNDVVATLEARGFTTLVTALEAADLDDDLATSGTFTVFAPTNAAFDALPPDVLDDLLDPANQPQLVDLLQYHILPEVQQARELRSLTFATTWLGPTISIDPLGGVLTLNGTTDVVRPDYLGSNGSIQAIANVLSPTAP